MPKKTWCILTVSILCFISFSTTLFAFSIVPMSVVFAPSGKESIQNYTVSNDSQDRKAIKITMLTWDMKENGEEVYAPAGDYFVVYPSQFVLDPESEQTVRVQWIGGSNIEAEQTYRMLVEQLPVNFDESGREQTGISILLRYLTALYVQPEDARPKVTLTEWEMRSDEQNKTMLRLEFINSGTAHYLFEKGFLKFEWKTASGNTRTEDVALTEFPALAGQNILSGSRRVFTVSSPQNREGDIVGLSFHQEKR